jgi:effector-binding domain-containing protein
MLDPARVAVEDPAGAGPAPVWLLRWCEGRAIEVLHIGPYQTVAAAYDALETYAEVHGLVVTGPAHEIFLTDPRRTSVTRPRVVVRMPVREE